MYAVSRGICCIPMSKMLFSGCGLQRYIKWPDALSLVPAHTCSRHQNPLVMGKSGAILASKASSFSHRAEEWPHISAYCIFLLASESAHYCILMTQQGCVTTGLVVSSRTTKSVGVFLVRMVHYFCHDRRLLQVSTGKSRCLQLMPAVIPHDRVALRKPLVKYGSYHADPMVQATLKLEKKVLKKTLCKKTCLIITNLIVKLLQPL